jgi:hypothetical protein
VLILADHRKARPQWLAVLVSAPEPAIDFVYDLGLGAAGQRLQPHPLYQVNVACLRQISLRPHFLLLGIECVDQRAAARLIRPTV